MTSALTIFNSPSLLGYLDYTHNTMYRVVGEFEFGYDCRYDEIALALAFVSVEIALDDDLYEYVPDESSTPCEGTKASGT
jgi:hypothetical protein